MFAVSERMDGGKEIVSEVEYDIGGEITPDKELLLLFIARCVINDEDSDNDDDNDDEKEGKDKGEDEGEDNSALKELPAGLLLKRTIKGYVRVGILNPSTWAPSGESDGSWNDWIAVTRRETLTVY